MGRNGVIGVVITVVVSVAAPGVAQWLRYPTEGIPRTADGKPESESARAAAAGRQAGFVRHLARRQSHPLPSRSTAFDRPAARRSAARSSPSTSVSNAGRPAVSAVGGATHETACGGRQPSTIRMCAACPTPCRGMWTLPHLTKAMHSPKLLVLLYEVNAMYRQIFIDGRPFPQDHERRRGTAIQSRTGTATRSSSRRAASATTSGSTCTAAR